MDLDFDGVKDLTYAATKENIYKIFDKLSKTMTESDYLFVYVIDHGDFDEYEQESYINLWNNECLYASELESILCQNRAAVKNILLGQCHAGGFIGYLKYPGIVAATACAYDESSYVSKKDYNFDEFVYRWAMAVNSSVGSKSESDYDGDGYVSMEEAFAYARSKDEQGETPQYSSMPATVGRELCFNRGLDPSRLYINHTAYRDNPRGVRCEWDSPSIWVRTSEDGGTEHQAPLFSMSHPTNYVGVRIRNGGFSDYVAGGSAQRYLHLYWSKGAPTTPSGIWLGSSNPPGGTPVGGRIATVPVDVDIKSGSDQVLTVPWTLPVSRGSVLDNGGYSLLAVVSGSSQTPGCFTDSDGTMDGGDEFSRLLMPSEPELAQKNSNVTLVSSTGTYKSKLRIENPSNAPKSYDLVIKSGGGDTDTYFSHMSAVVSVPSSSGLKTYQVGSLPYTIGGLSLGSGAVEEIEVSYTAPAQMVNYSLVGRTCPIVFSQRDGTGRTIGEYTLGLRTEDRKISFGGIKSSAVGDGNVLLEAEDMTADEYCWSDAGSSVLGTEPALEVTPTVEDKTYTLCSIYGGEAVTAAVTLNGRRSIENVSQSADSATVTVVLDGATNAAEASVVFTGAGNPTEVLRVPVGRGQTSVDADMSMFTPGAVCVCLTEDGGVSDTVTIIKK